MRTFLSFVLTFDDCLLVLTFIADMFLETMPTDFFLAYLRPKPPSIALLVRKEPNGSKTAT